MTVQDEYNQAVLKLSNEIHDRLEGLETLEQFYNIDKDAHLKSAIEEIEKAVDTLDKWLVRKELA